jgi:hypothetical protein
LALLKSSYFPEEDSGNHIKPEVLKSSYFPEEDGGNHIKPEVSPKPPKLSNSLFIS